MTTTPLRPPCPHCGDAGDAKLRQLRDELTPVIGSERHSPSYQQCASRVVTRIESLLAAPAPSPSAPPAAVDARLDGTDGDDLLRSWLRRDHNPLGSTMEGVVAELARRALAKEPKP